MMLPLLLWLRLVTAGTPATAEAACADLWPRESDIWWECSVALETIRCETQGWCGP